MKNVFKSALKFKALALLLALMVLPFMASCSDDDDPTSSMLVITNSSTVTLERFRVVFWTERGETLTDREYGTFAPGETTTVEIPIGASEYYMATYSSGYWFFSPNYSVSITNNRLTDSTIGEWRTN